jgi:Do/DeqQ family serine protease
MKKFGSLLIVSLLSGVLTLGAYKLFFDTTANNNAIITTAQPNNYARSVGFGAETVDFATAADKAVHSVVHVKNVSRRMVNNPIMEFFYGYGGQQQQEQVGTGSGVIISEDGYIVTNNHVIKDASDIEITLNNKKIYKAKVIGTDIKMDIALLKIDAPEKLPYSVFADSDATRVGEWVLAVGNPYNLTSTVTAGIISAKARNLDTNGMQSFIQTDAAVNPGNSGGALVNTRGELIGINTMISSQTGSYVGYSFAVPSNITRKIIEDLMQFGNVQRGILGIEGRELNGAFAKELKISESEGVYVFKVTKKSGADLAGIVKGDIIIKLDNQSVSTMAELLGYINSKRPNDKIQVSYIRNAKTQVATVTLVKNILVTTEFKGLELEDIVDADKKKFRISEGVKIKEISNERLMGYADEIKGGIITRIGNTAATDVETVSRLMANVDDKQSIQIEMITANGQVVRLYL